MIGCLAAATPAADALQTFSSKTHGYSIQIPATWHAVPDAKVQQALAAAAVRDPSKRGVVWEAVFQQPAEGTSGGFGFPYVICQITPYPGGKRLTETAISDAVKAMTAMQVTGGGSTLTVPAARYDAATHVAWQPRDITAPIGPIKGLNVMHYGSKAMVAIMCYDLAASYETNKSELDQIEASFKFDAGSAYSPDDASKHVVPLSVRMQTGELDLTFTERSPLSNPKEIARRLTMKEQDLAIDYDLKQRPFKTYVPQNYDPSVPCGIFVYLGYKDSEALPQDWEPALDKAHMIFITPVNHHGEDFPNSIPSWQMMGLAFDAVHNLRQRFHIDERRIYRMSKGQDSMRFALASADVFSGFVVTGDDTWAAPIVLPNRSQYPQAFLPPPPPLFAEARTRAFILATEDWGPPESCWHMRTPAMKRGGFEHILELKLTWLGDLHYPMMKVQWFEDTALPFLDSIAAQTSKSAPVKIPTHTPGPASPPPIASPATQTGPAAPTPAAANPDAQRLMTLAELYVKAKQPKRAREKLEAIIRLYPNDPAAGKAKEILKGVPEE